MVAASPVLLMHAFTNWDLAAVALTGLGLWAWSRGSPTWAGVALGVGHRDEALSGARAARAGDVVRAVAQAAGGREGDRGQRVALVVAYLPAIALSYQTPAALYDSRSSFPRVCAVGASAARMAVVPVAVTDPRR